MSDSFDFVHGAPNGGNSTNSSHAPMPAVSFVPPYRATAHSYIKEQLATASHGGSALVSADSSATAPLSPSASAATQHQKQQQPTQLSVTTVPPHRPLNPLAVPPPPFPGKRIGAPAAAADAAPLMQPYAAPGASYIRPPPPAPAPPQDAPLPVPYLTPPTRPQPAAMQQTQAVPAVAPYLRPPPQPQPHAEPAAPSPIEPAAALPTPAAPQPSQPTASSPLTTPPTASAAPPAASAPAATKAEEPIPPPAAAAAVTAKEEPVSPTTPAEAPQLSESQHSSPAPQQPAAAPAAPTPRPTPTPTPVSAPVPARMAAPPAPARPIPTAAVAHSAVSRSAPAAPIRIPELSVILARGRLSRVPDFSPDATGEDIYRTFCPGGDSYPGDGVSAGPDVAATTAAAGSSARSATAGGESPVQHNQHGDVAAEVGQSVSGRDEETAALAPATRGQLPPGWERRTFHNTTFYLDHVSREAHEQEPWVVWWGRAGNADPGSA